MDFSRMSDEELEKLANSAPNPLDFATMSDEELDRIANPPPPGSPKPGKIEALGRGLFQGVTLGGGEELTAAMESQPALPESMRNMPGLPMGVMDADFLEPVQTYQQARDESRAANRAAKEAHPWTYGAGEFGGAAATALIPGLGAAGSLGKAAGTAGALGAASGFGGSEAEDLGGLAFDTGLGAAVGAGIGSAGYGLMKGAEKLAPIIGKGLKLNPKDNQAAIREAAERLGVKATPGMIYDDPVIQGLESSLSQSPSLPGMLTRQTTQPVERALDDVAKGSLKDASSLSRFEIGERVKSGIDRAVNNRAAGSRKIFQEIAESTPDIALNEKSLARVGRNITNLDDVALTPGSSWANKANTYAEWLQNAKSVRDVTKLRQIVGKELEAAQGPEREVLGSIYERLTRLEENSIVRGAVDTMRGMAQKPAGKTGDVLANQGESIGLDMVSKLKGAKNEFASLMSDLRDLSGQTRLGRLNGPQSFVDKIDNVRSERIGEKLFPVDDVNVMRSMQKQFPEQAQLLRQGRLGDIQRQATSGAGELSTPKFFNSIKSIGDESADILFGQGNLSKIADAKTVMQSLPEYIGPSGTPKGLEFLSMFNPAMQARELGRYGFYKGITTDKVQKIADALLKSPRIQELANNNPKAFQAMVLDFSRRVSPERALPKAASTELDEDSSTPANYQEYPDSSMREGRNQDQMGANRLGELVKSSPQMFGKFANVLQQAEQRGPQGLAATHFLLQSNNPEYRQILQRVADTGGNEYER
jgi:hypothetical protein